MTTRSSLLLSLLCACAGGSAAAPTAPTARPSPAAAANTSIATARALAPGERLTVELPCEGALYFGPFEFAGEGEAVTIATRHRSPGGAQICGGGGWVDSGDEQIEPAGVGCVEQAAVTEDRPRFTYAPGAGNPAANPIYLKLLQADPRPEGCQTSVLELTRE